MAYWTLAARPDRFLAAESVRDRESAWWMTGGRSLHLGDRVAIWKYQGRDPHRGVIALGEAVTEPVAMPDPPEDDAYWVPGADRGFASAPRILIRYVRPPNLPIWFGTPYSVVNQLPVTRAHGGTAHRISDEQWQALVDEAGGWPEGYPATDPAETLPHRLTHEVNSTQGYIADASTRRAIELHAMDLIMQLYQSDGWDVVDVSAHQSFDLLCTKADSLLHVEVKGTTSKPDAVLVTANEVLTAQRNPESTALAIIHSISLHTDSNGDPVASGGIVRVLFPWRPHPKNLTPIAYRYQIPNETP